MSYGIRLNLEVFIWKKCGQAVTYEACGCGLGLGYAHFVYKSKYRST